MRTYVPKISFISTFDTEKTRLLNLTAIIASGFYNRKGFTVTPVIIPKIKSVCIIAPDFLRKLTKKYWQEATTIGQSLPINLTRSMENEMSQFKFGTVDNNIVNNFSQDWDKKSSEFWIIINEIFQTKLKRVREIEVRITNYGSESSFSLLTKKHKQKLIIHLRTDASIDKLAWGIISAFCWPQETDGDLSFSQRTAIVDFIMNLPKIKKLFPHYLPTKNLSRISSDYIQQSLNYCRFLGVNFPQDCHQIINSSNHIFGTKELKILNKLVESENDLVTNDELANILWGEDDFRSYWAINKMIQRLRQKLPLVKLKSSSLITVRGRGYKWIN